MPDGILTRASQAESAEKYDEARKLYESATREFPESAEVWAAYGEHLRFYAHDDAAADIAFNKALKATRTSSHAIAFAWRGLAELSAKKGNTHEAIERFQRSLKAQPLADTHRSLCHLYCVQHDFANAAHHAGEAVKLSPDDAIARLLYAAQLERAKKPGQAREQFLKALEIANIDEDGNGAERVHCCVFYNSAGYLAVAGENKRAIRMLRKFFDTPNHRHLTRQDIERDADFITLTSDPDFQSLLDRHLPRNLEGSGNRAADRPSQK